MQNFGKILILFACSSSLAGCLMDDGAQMPPGVDGEESLELEDDVAIDDLGDDFGLEVIGGDVIRHDSIQNLIIAKDIRGQNAGFGGNCTIWNFAGGSSYSWVSGANAVGNCRTASMNGRTYSWTVWSDTDAFTVQFEPYWVRMRDGTWRRLDANVYTKITDIENAHCYRESDGVNCYVSLG